MRSLHVAPFGRNVGLATLARLRRAPYVFTSLVEWLCGGWVGLERFLYENDNLARRLD